tara:strand:+ start:164 stop:553 length:390 start_codon:yes stop_codon:yes gene_type:complete
MEIKSINDQHKQIIDSFTNEIEKFVYRITDNNNHKSFKHFLPVIQNIQQLHNNVADELETLKINETEWVYMLPNYLLFAGVGFAAAIKNAENEHMINYETEELFQLISNTITSLEILMKKTEFKNKQEC